MPLSELKVRNARPAEKPQKLSDGGGMYMLVAVSGAKLWRMDYRFAEKRRTLSFGSYPDLSLAEARRRLEAARSLLAQGRDPGLQKKLDKIQARLSAANTFRSVAEEWLDKKLRAANKAPRTITKAEWLLRFAYADFGNRAISTITAPEILVTLRKLEARGLQSAVTARAVISRVFRFGIASSLCDRDPATDLAGALTPHVIIHRAAILDPKRIGSLLRALDSYDGHVSTLGALRLAPLVFVRPFELRYAEWRDIDLEAARWRIPATKMKMKREHIVPLSRQAVEALNWMGQFSGSEQLVFPSVRSYERPMSDATLNAALRRLGYAKEEMSIHGFRRIASTLLNEQGWNPDWIELQLAHVEKNNVRAAYNAAQHLQGRAEMMQAWADYLDKLRREKLRTQY